ncbi:MAG: metallophosphoesterase, partial [Actinomycetota bacterium]
MRILHTADWHVGKSIKGLSRLAEHEAVLADIVRIADAERVDIVVVAGD